MNYFHKSAILVLVALASCMPKEEAVEPFDRGGVNAESLSSGAQKNDVLFYDLETAALVTTARPIDFDIIAYEDKLLINMFRYLKVAEISETLTDRTDTAGLSFSTLQDAEHQWSLMQDQNYVVYMGKDDAGQEQGYYKLRLTKDLAAYKVSYAPLAATNLSEFTLTEGQVFSLLSSELKALPSPDECDLIMGKYLHYFEVEEVEYEVFGALTPSAQIIELSTPFDQLNFDLADSLLWEESPMDEIGYDWKFYSLDKGAYEIAADQHFLIKNRNGFYFKFRFTNFYDGVGQSGHPSFEFQLL